MASVLVLCDFQRGPDWAARGVAFVRANSVPLNELSAELWSQQAVQRIMSWPGGKVRIEATNGRCVDTTLSILQLASGNRDVLDDSALVGALEVLRESRILEGTDTTYEELVRWILHVTRLGLNRVEKSKVGVEFGLSRGLVAVKIPDADTQTVADVVRDLLPQTEEWLVVPTVDWFIMIVDTP